MPNEPHSIVYEFLVRCQNPEDLDRIVMSMGGLVEQDGYGQYRKRGPEGDQYKVRVFTDPGMMIFMIQQQGYGEVTSGPERITVPK